MRYKVSQFLFIIGIGLGCASFCNAQDILRVPESAIRVHFQSNTTTVELPVRNDSRVRVSAQIVLQLIDPHGAVQVQASRSISLSSGITKAQIVLPAIPAPEKDQVKAHLFLYRLRYSVAPDTSDGSSSPPIEGVVSVSEVAPQFFELHTAAPEFVQAGNHYEMHVRAIHPVTSAPSPGVVVQGSLDIDKAHPVLTRKAVTDSRGYATLEFTMPSDLDSDRIQVTITGTRDEFTATSDSELMVPRGMSTSLSTDKPLYQPGQTLHIRLLAFDINKKALAAQRLTLEISDPEDTLVYREEEKTSPYGIASADWKIPDNLRLGTYEITASFEDNRNEDARASARVTISRYELPTFAVTTKPDRSYYLPGQSASIEIRANYIYGEPVRHGHVRLVHETEREWDYREQKWKIEKAETYEGETDSQGKFVAQVDLTMEHKDLADTNYYRFEDSTFSAYFTDSVTERTENRRFDLRVTRDPIHVYLIKEGPLAYPHEFYLSTDYADGTPAQCEVQIKWAPIESPTKGNASQPASEKLLRQIRTNRYGVAKITGLNTPEIAKSGEFIFVLDAKDYKGSAGHQTENVESYDEREPSIRVATNKTLYQQGEPVEVELKSSAPDTRIIVDAVHDEKVVASLAVRLHHGHASVVFPPNQQFQNKVTIVAYAFGVSADRDPGEAEFDSYRNVLFPKNHELNLDVRLAKATYQPGENVPAELRISGPDGQQVQGAIGLVVVDKAVEERQRTDQDLRRNAGFFGYLRMFDDEELKGIHLADLDKLDVSKTLPEGLELVAEILLQSRSEGGPKFFDVESAGRNTLGLFGSEINPQMKSIRNALDHQYAVTAEYPKTETALENVLARDGFNFSGLRDPWNMPYRVKFGVEREWNTLEIWTLGPDKKLDTSDDYCVLAMKWPYFRPYTEAIIRAVEEFHARTGEYIRDAVTLNAELATHGVHFDALRDSWGRSYKSSFSANGNSFFVTVTSAGPDGIFSTDENSSDDDFDVTTVGMDYFRETQTRIDHALTENFNKTLEYPQNLNQFRKVLVDYGIDWDALKDPWGHTYVALFSEEAKYADDVVVRGFQNGSGNSQQLATIVPVTQFVEWIHIRSEGAGGKERTPRDFEAASFSHTIVKQSSTDSSPVTLSSEPILSVGMGAITGTVFDPSGSVIIGAEVSAKNSSTEEIFMAISNQAGSYTLRNIPPGHYALAFSSANFKSLVITNISVFSANTTVVNASLEVGATSVSVEVSAGLARTETMNTAMVSSKTAPGTPRSNQVLPPISTPRLRQYFPETLFWRSELVTDSKGLAHLSFPLADSITTWKLSAVASTENGEIGTAEKDIRAFQPFFVEHDPPRFLTDGDEIDLPVVLRNYLNRNLRMNVEMKPENWFVPLSPASEKAEVSAGDAATEHFRFRAAAPIKNAKQRITAIESGSAKGDSIERTVTVRPNGEERTETRSEVFDDVTSLDVQIPAQAFPGSLEGTLKIYPNLNAHVLESVEAVLERPYGCAEQDISSTYPSILLLKYLKSTGMESSPLAPKARRYIQQGYERLLSYRGDHGGFSYWGKGDADLALTAYALRFLNDASKFVDIDDSIVSEQLKWILGKAEGDGRWIALDWNRKEDSHRSLILTAYIARTISDLDFHETASNSNEQLEKATSVALKLALEYLGPKVAETDEPYLTASYALALPNDEANSRLTASLDHLRKLERHEADSSYWMLETNTPFFGWGLAGRIETTALVLQALKKGTADGTPNSDRELLSRGLLFLLKNQDRFGIWYSSQATINVLDALRVLTLRNDGTIGASSAFSAQSSKAEILLDGHPVQSVDLPSSNELVAPVTVDISKFLSPGNHRVEIHRTAGSTPASVQAVTLYYVPWVRTESDAALEHQEKASDALRLAVRFDKPTAKVGENIQCTVDAERIGFRGYGMMLAEIGLPPAAEVDRESLDRAMKETGWDIEKYDVLPDSLIVYLWPHAGGTKFTFTFKARYGLKALTPPSILYDYYNPEAQATVLPTLFTVRK